MRLAATLLIFLLMSPKTQALPTERIFFSGFGVGEPPNDCSLTSIPEPELEAKFLRRTTVQNACIPPSVGGNPEYCTGNGCGGNPGCAVPLSPPTQVIAMLPADFVAIEEAVGTLTIPFRVFTTNCVMTIQFSAPAMLRHGYTLQTEGLDALKLISADGVLVSMPAYTWVVATGGGCEFISLGAAFAASVVAEAHDAIVAFETANAPQDAPGSTVCPVTQ